MECRLFLETQGGWLAKGQPAGGGASKRKRLVSFEASASFHLSFAEQYGSGGGSRQWRGARAADTVFLSFSEASQQQISVHVEVVQHSGSSREPGGGDGRFPGTTPATTSGGSSSSSTSIVLRLEGEAYSLHPAQLRKVVCSPAVHAAATEARQPPPDQQQRQQPGSGGAGSLLACAAPAPSSSGKQAPEYVTLVMPHVCLNLYMTQQQQQQQAPGGAQAALAIENLARFASIVVSAAQAAPTAPQPPPLLPLVPNTSTPHCAAALPAAAAAVPQQQQQQQQQPGVPPPSPLALARGLGAAALVNEGLWLEGVACEVRLLEMLLAPPSPQVDASHILKSLGHLHAGLRRTPVT